MKTPWANSIRLKLFLSYLLLAVLTASILVVLLNEINWEIHRKIESSVSGLAEILAERAEQEITNGQLPSNASALSLVGYPQQKSTLGVKNNSFETLISRIFITDAKGIVISDSAQQALGQDFSKKTAVYNALNRNLGHRAFSNHKLSWLENTPIYISTPIIHQQNIIGSLTLEIPTPSTGFWLRTSPSRLWILIGFILLLPLTIGALMAWRFSKKIWQFSNDAKLALFGKKTGVHPPNYAELDALFTGIQQVLESQKNEAHTRDLMHRLTHELKIPMTSMMRLIDSMASEKGEAQLKLIQTQLRAEAHRAQEILHQILEPMRDGSFPQNRPADHIVLNQLITSQIQLLQERAAKDNIRFHFPEALQIEMEGDRHLLGQAIYNLLENALDFSPSNSVINIRLTDYKTHREIAIRDTGSGIPPHAENKIFEKYYSLPRPRTQQKSTGLGLNWAQEAARLHGGNVKLHNHEWGGAEAILSLPKTPIVKTKKSKDN